MAMAKVPLVTNQFKLTLHSRDMIYTYAIDAFSEKEGDAKQRIREIV